MLDPNLVNDTPNTTPPNVSQDDSVELYLNANHVKGTPYDVRFDRHFAIGYNDNNVFFEKNGKIEGVQSMTQAIPDGYTVELAIPWSNLNVTASPGLTIGFDLGNNDDDNGGATPESQVVWNGTDTNYEDTSAFGDLTLVESGTGSGVVIEDDLGFARGGLLVNATDGMCLSLGNSASSTIDFARSVYDAGFRWVRLRFVWRNIETTRGFYDFEGANDELNYVEMVESLQGFGIGALFQIELGNDLYTGLAGHKPFDEAGRTNAANFLKAAAAKFKGKKVMFELLNEPNIDKFWPLDGPDSGTGVSIAEIQQGAVNYAALAQVVVAAMRSPDGDPDVFIVGPALAGRGGNNAGELRKAHEYIKQLYALDALSPLFDRISLHLYTAEGEAARTDIPIGQEPESVDIDLYRGRDLINDSSTNIMCTEQGWKAARNANGYRTDEGNRLQASFNVRDHIIALSKSVRFRTWYG